jgi:hypothetical protein
LDATLTTLLCKKIVMKFKEAKTGCKLAESSKKGFGSKRAVLSMIIIIIIIIIMNKIADRMNGPTD